jgi:excisionase family DNA binding protein
VSGPTGWEALGGLSFALLLAKQETARQFGEQEKRLAEKESAFRPAVPSPARRSNCMTLGEAAETLRCSKKTIWRLRRDGEIRDCERFGKQGTVVRSDVLRLASASSRKGA